MPTIKEIEEEIISEFDLLNSFEDQSYEYLIELGKKMPNLTEELKTDDSLIKGCLSKVWLHSSLDNGKVYYQADSNAFIVKGVIALLIRVLSGHKPDEILNSDLSFVEKINLRSFLTSQRGGGLDAMIKQMKLYALAFKTKEENN